MILVYFSVFVLPPGGLLSISKEKIIFDHFCHFSFILLFLFVDRSITLSSDLDQEAGVGDRLFSSPSYLNLGYAIQKSGIIYPPTYPGESQCVKA